MSSILELTRIISLKPLASDRKHYVAAMIIAQRAQTNMHLYSRTHGR